MVRTELQRSRKPGSLQFYIIKITEASSTSPSRDLLPFPPIFFQKNKIKKLLSSEIYVHENIAASFWFYRRPRLAPQRIPYLGFFPNPVFFVSTTFVTRFSWSALHCFFFIKSMLLLEMLCTTSRLSFSSVVWLCERWLSEYLRPVLQHWQPLTPAVEVVLMVPRFTAAMTLLVHIPSCRRDALAVYFAFIRTYRVCLVHLYYPNVGLTYYSIELLWHYFLRLPMR